VDAPFGRPVEQAWLDDQARNGMDWIYVHFSQATPELIRYAHGQGLRVLVYTVNDPREVAHLRTERPDAVITDRAALAAAAW
jgi:glycerophosphoryl diester phosphodiesterase